MKIWTLSALLAVGVIAVACGSDPQEDKEPETALSSLPLSAACSACAQTAMNGSCSAELSACAANSSCFDVESCLVGCDPNDVACFSDCAQASAAFNDLTSCVFCDSCPQECAGEWTCANQPPVPQPGGQCDNSGDCNSCSLCATASDCADAFQQCVSAPGCHDLALCVDACNSDAGCVSDCLSQSPPSDEFEALASCVACNACPSDCVVEAQVLGCSGGSSGGNSCDGSGDCASCASCAAQGPCMPELGACWQNPDCSAFVQCVQGCDDTACLDACLQANPNASPEVDALVSCAICDQCPSDCGASNTVCP